jgi:flagellar basal body-associated protein FliL
MSWSEGMQQLPMTPMVPETKKKKNYKWLIISLLVVLGIIIVALILLYVFQDQLF